MKRITLLLFALLAHVSVQSSQLYKASSTTGDGDERIGYYFPDKHLPDDYRLCYFVMKDITPKNVTIERWGYFHAYNNAFDVWSKDAVDKWRYPGKTAATDFDEYVIYHSTFNNKYPKKDQRCYFLKSINKGAHARIHIFYIHQLCDLPIREYHGKYMKSGGGEGFLEYYDNGAWLGTYFNGIWREAE